jgi:uncharacterized protein (DUF736 family)
MRRPFVVAVLAVALGCSASSCASRTPRSGPDETTILRHDDGEVAGVVSYPNTPVDYYEYARFRLEAPALVDRLHANLEVPDDSDVVAHVWQSYGGNGAALEDGFNLGDDGPLGTATREVETSESGDWVEFVFEEPIVVDPGRTLFAGIVVEGNDGARLHHDGAQPEFEQKFPRSNSWRTTDSRQEGGGLPIDPSPGDFLIRMEVSYLKDPEAEPSFESVPVEQAGLEAFRRAAVADVDGDGDLDVATDGPRLYLNDGDGQFEEVTDKWFPAGISSQGGIFGDYDNDGDPDYFAVGNDDRLLEHRGDRYVDVTDRSGIGDTQQYTCGGETNRAPAPTEGAAWFDYDNDGRLDLYQANYQYNCGPRSFADSDDRLWHNEGDGTFTPVDLPAGAEGAATGPRAGRGVAPADADGDGWVDLLVTNYRLDPNFFFDNREGTLRELGPESGLAGVPTDYRDRNLYGHSIGAAWGDVNRDGRLDVFVANLAHPRLIGVSQKAALYRNDGREGGVSRFSNVTDEAGFRYRETAANPNFWDYDNDGDLDLFYTCTYANRRSMMYRNDGHPNWREVSYETGIEVENGWGAVVADFDGDGRLDLLARDRMFFNRDAEGRGAVFVRAVGAGAGRTNRDGVGARVVAEVDGEPVVRERYGGHGSGLQDSPWMHVGIGDAEAVDLEVRFPVTGTRIEVSDAEPGERIIVRESNGVERTTRR